MSACLIDVIGNNVVTDSTTHAKIHISFYKDFTGQIHADYLADLKYF